MKISTQIGKSIDRKDSFLGGHQVVHPRSYKRTPPSWTLNDKKVQKVLLRSFPKLGSNDNQREAAARWATVIHLYFRLGYTRGQIAEELCTTTERVKGVIRSIYRVAEGRRADGKGELKRVKKSLPCP